MDLRRKDLDREEVMWKARNGLALNFRELAIATGYSYGQWCSWRFRGLPIIQGKITLRRATDWIQKHEMAPGGRVNEAFDICEKMEGVMSDIWWALRDKKREPGSKKHIQRQIDEISEQYRNFRRRVNTSERVPDTETIVDVDRTSASSVEEATFPSDPVVFLKSPFSAEEEAALCKARTGMALDLRELSLAMGYSYRTLLRWKQEGLPLVDRKLTRADAWAWRRSKPDQRRPRKRRKRKSS